MTGGVCHKYITLKITSLNTTSSYPPSDGTEFSKSLETTSHNKASNCPKKKNHGNKFQGKCHHCGKIGHKANQTVGPKKAIQKRGHHGGKKSKEKSLTAPMMK
eukprot:3029852-Ditylum_brightwellii.AAC.1